MLNNLKNILIGIFSAVIVVAIGASAYTAFAGEGTDETIVPETTVNFGQGNGNGNGNTNTGTVTDHTGNGNGTGVSVLDIPASDLSPEETAALLFMREEEKLARDVYNTLYEVWGQSTFANIASSEQRHMDSIKKLIDRYGLDDPVGGNPIGVFRNDELQYLYDALVAQGSQSIVEALNVGAAIEEIDILDLEEYIAQTDNADIQMVYENLMKGSRNHLRSFVSTIQRQTGITYQPQYLSQEAYQAIVGSEIESGGNRGRRGNG